MHWRGDQSGFLRAASAQAAGLAAALAAAALVAASAIGGARPEDEEEGFVPLFDGKTLAGWHAVPPESAADWSVQGGGIVGQGSADRLAYLVWKDADLRDFDLRLRYRIPGKGNTGIEIRACPDPSGKRPLEGYHADLGHVGIGPGVLGAWDLHFARRREFPCPRGTRLVIDEEGRPHHTPIPGALTAERVRPHGWNEVRIVWWTTPAAAGWSGGPSGSRYTTRARASSSRTSASGASRPPRPSPRRRAVRPCRHSDNPRETCQRRPWAPRLP